MKLRLGDRVNIFGHIAEFVDWDNAYLYFKHEWSPAVFKIKKEEIECLNIIETTMVDD